MKLFGYPGEGYEEVHSLELTSVTVAANPQELRKIARFFEQMAIDMNQDSSGFEHQHLMDNQEGFDGNSDIQIYNPAFL